MSTQGERGATGDHGQDGAQGRDGRVGLQGERGHPGKPPVTRMEVMVMVAFFTFCLLLLGWRVEVNQHGIQDGVRARCEARNANIARVDKLYAGLVAIERDNPFAKQGKAAAATIQRRINLYTDNMLIPTDCGRS